MPNNGIKLCLHIINPAWMFKEVRTGLDFFTLEKRKDPKGILLSNSEECHLNKYWIEEGHIWKWKITLSYHIENVTDLIIRLFPSVPFLRRVCCLVTFQCSGVGVSRPYSDLQKSKGFETFNLKRNFDTRLSEPASFQLHLGPEFWVLNNDKFSKTNTPQCICIHNFPTLFPAGACI